jgi:hypothetical protein
VGVDQGVPTPGQGEPAGRSRDARFLARTRPTSRVDTWQVDDISREIERQREQRERQAQSHRDAQTRAQQQAEATRQAAADIATQFLAWARNNNVRPMLFNVGWFRSVHGWALGTTYEGEGYHANFTNYLLQPDGAWLTLHGSPPKLRGYPGCGWTREATTSNIPVDSVRKDIAALVVKSGLAWP